MPEDDTYNNQSQQEQVRRYLSGEMTPSEMHALEKEALQDPFLADAIDGMSVVEPEKLHTDLNELRDRIAERIEPKVVRLPGAVSWRKIAVAAAVVGLGIFTTVFLINRQKPPQLAETVARNKSSSPDSARAAVQSFKSDSLQIPDTTALVATEIIQKNQAAAKQEEKNTSLAKATAPKLQPAADSRKETNDTLLSRSSQRLAEQEQVNLVTPESDKKANTIDLRKAPASSAPDPVAFNLKKDVGENNGRLFLFSGQVTDANLQPVSFANIAVKNSNNLAYTDAKGNFRLFAGDSLLNIDVKSVGYLTNSVLLNYNNPNTRLILQQKPTQSKKGKAFSNKKTVPEAEPEDSLTLNDSVFISTEPAAEPADGWGPYHLYLMNNVRTQRSADNRLMEGTVVVSFLVNDNSWLTDFKIDKSLTPACDREALRLIKEGPKWELYNTEKPIRVKVTVSF